MKNDSPLPLFIALLAAGAVYYGWTRRTEWQPTVTFGPTPREQLPSPISFTESGPSYPVPVDWT